MQIQAVGNQKYRWLLASREDEEVEVEQDEGRFYYFNNVAVLAKF